jgi:hypothetical protein
MTQDPTEYSRAWKSNNRVRARELNRQSNQRVKLKAFDLFGSKCQRCGFEDSRALQIDHINGNGGLERKNGLRVGRMLYGAIVRGEEPLEKYQLLCANCNWIKRWENNECRKDV